MHSANKSKHEFIVQCICIISSCAWFIDTSTSPVQVTKRANQWNSVGHHSMDAGFRSVVICYNHKYSTWFKCNLNMYVQALRHHLLTSQFYLMFASNSSLKLFTVDTGHAIMRRYENTTTKRKKKNTVYCCLLLASWVFSHNEKRG